ncbi:MAG: GPR endopeptidase [Clostridia bacterium]|nr:GPR endopeptidase [Clostridia bacterium]
MQGRTDLALECLNDTAVTDGIDSKNYKKGDVLVTVINVKSENAAKNLGKPRGKYITFEVPEFTNSARVTEEDIEAVKSEIENLLPSGTILVAGLGNTDITPDALGPKTAAKILATRHIPNDIKQSIGLQTVRSVAVIATGVLGKTGIETAELILSATKQINPAAVVLIDALASRSVKRLGRTIQISDSGISPGSGVGNSRKEISKKTLGVPVISIGVPTVVDAKTLASDVFSTDNLNGSDEFEQMIVTPKEIDLLIDRASEYLSLSINCALQPTLSADEITYLL